MAYKFKNEQTARFFEMYEYELENFYAICGDITLEYIQQLLGAVDGAIPLEVGGWVYFIIPNDIRNYFDQKAEDHYYERLDAINGGDL